MSGFTALGVARGRILLGCVEQLLRLGLGELRVLDLVRGRARARVRARARAKKRARTRARKRPRKRAKVGLTLPSTTVSVARSNLSGVRVVESHVFVSTWLGVGVGLEAGVGVGVGVG